MNRLERSQKLLTEIIAAEKTSSTDPTTQAIRAKILHELDAIVPAYTQIQNTGAPSRQPTIASVPSTASPATPTPFVTVQVLLKFVAGALPWVIFSLAALPFTKQGDKIVWSAFVGMQIFSISFGFVAVLIPRLGSRWIDYVGVPWTMFLLTGGVIITIGAARGFRTVRESSRRKAIQNNLRLLRAAVFQYLLENGKTEATLSDIVGPDRYINSLSSIDGEDYSNLPLTADGVWEVTTRRGLKVCSP